MGNSDNITNDFEDYEFVKVRRTLGLDLGFVYGIGGPNLQDYLRWWIRMAIHLPRSLKSINNTNWNSGLSLTEPS